MVLKRQKALDWNSYLKELHLVANLSHENIVQVLDVLVGNADHTIVFADHGDDLHSMMKRQDQNPSNTPGLSWEGIVIQVCRGLQYLRQQLVVHADLKPQNIVVDASGRVRIVDFGMAFAALPGFRTQYSKEDIMGGALQYCTLPYRAVEILLGDSAFHYPMDMWALGCIWVELLCKARVFEDNSEIGTIVKILRTVGSPTGEALAYVERLPLWSAQYPNFKAPSWPTALAERLSYDRVCVLMRIFDYNPATRATPSDVLLGLQANLPAAPDGPSGLIELDAPPSGEPPLGVSPGSPVPFPLFVSDGKFLFAGARGDWCLRSGMLQGDVLEWLRKDPAFCGTAKDLGWSFTKKASDRRVENGCKVEIAGHCFGSKNKSGFGMHGLDASKPMPGRVRAWLGAFKHVNRENLQQFDDLIRTNLEKLSDKELGANGKGLKEGTSKDWLGRCGAIQVMGCSTRQDPLHFDGGCSYWHMGITLYGKRTLILKQPEDDDVLLSMGPGHIYAGNLCSAQHQVRHDAPGDSAQPGASAQTLHVEGLGDVQVVVLLRSAVFRKSMASLSANGPNPHTAWHPARYAVNEAVEKLNWWLPSLSDCEAEEVQLGVAA